MIGDPTAPGGMAQPGHVPGAPGRSAGSGGGGGGISELKQHLQVLKGFSWAWFKRKTQNISAALYLRTKDVRRICRCAICGLVVSVVLQSSNPTLRRLYSFFPFQETEAAVNGDRKQAESELMEVRKNGGENIIETIARFGDS